jgi:leader peptidase (prepilin peptidase)/N-methyltransferase
MVGSMFGSFFACLTYRIGKGESVVTGRSYCDNCKEKIPFWHNIPIISYLVLKGKCRYCGNKISRMYPLTEFITGLWLCGLVFYFLFDPSLEIWSNVYKGTVVLYFLFFIPVIFIDIQFKIVPDGFTYTGIILGFLVSFLPGEITPLQSFLGIVAGGSPLFLIGWIGQLIIKDEAMGGGDIKLMAALGSLLGAKTFLLGLFFGSLCGAIGGVIFWIINGFHKRQKIAFAPYLLLGTAIAFFFGDKLLLWYADWIYGFF